MESVPTCTYGVHKILLYIYSSIKCCLIAFLTLKVVSYSYRQIFMCHFIFNGSCFRLGTSEQLQTCVGPLHISARFPFATIPTDFLLPQGRAELVFTRYLQRWGKDYLRRRLDWTLDEMMGNPANPRHITSALCPCQYVEEILANKQPRTDVRDCCPIWSRFLARLGIH